MRYVLPFAIFLALAALLGAGLRREPATLPSARLDRPAPASGCRSRRCAAGSGS